MSRLNDIYAELEKRNSQQMNSDIAASDNSYEAQKKQTEDTYNAKIKDTNSSYDDLYRENAVQKLINERQIAENMESLGLTDSGLNRTQQTATQLSYANTKGKIDTQKQKAIDSLTLELAGKISAIDANKLSAAENIRSTYKNNWNSQAQSIYSDELEKEAAIQKAQYEYQSKLIEQQAKDYKEYGYMINRYSNLLNPDYTGTLRQNGITVMYDKSKGKTYYTDLATGKKIPMDYHQNPYTGTINKDTKYGCFSNGYQPNNIGSVKLVDSGDRVIVSGNEQKVFILPSQSRSENQRLQNRYVWDRVFNRYRRVKWENQEWKWAD